MPEEIDFQDKIQRIGEIVEQFEANPSSQTRAMGKELLETTMALYGAVLERMLEYASQTGDPGENLLCKCANDEMISAVLLLHGLHPETLHSRVTRALETMRPNLEAQASSAELISIENDGAVLVRLHVKSHSSCGSVAAGLKSDLETALENAAPDASSITIEDDSFEQSIQSFVPITQLVGARPENIVLAARPEGNSD